MAKQAPKDYLTIEEAAEQLGIHRTSLYPYLNQLNIKRHKFKLSRRLYISAPDFERIKQLKMQPWKAEELIHE